MSLRTPDDVLPSLPSSARRELSSILSQTSQRQIFVAAMNKKMSYREYLATMVWDLLTQGECLTADGRTIKVETSKEWLDVLKFIVSHIDGPASVNDSTATQLNVVKVYVGIDPNKI